MTVNYKMVLQYDGTRYNGWQKQGNTKNTIQGKLEEILSRYFLQELELNGSGRTDAGVHAACQTANFKVDYSKKNAEKDMVDMSTPAAIMDELNGFLPEDIRILSLEMVDNRFHARLNAVGKEYRYYISLDRKRDVFARRYMAAIEHPERLDVEKMKSASEKLIGEHDFQGFSDNKSKKSTVRRIDNVDFNICDMGNDGKCLEIIFRGNGFLYHTVRLLVGTLLSIGLNESKADIIEAVFESRDRRKVPYMAPAEGLFLYKVEY